MFGLTDGPGNKNESLGMTGSVNEASVRLAEVGCPRSSVVIHVISEI